MGLKYCA